MKDTNFKINPFDMDYNEYILSKNSENFSEIEKKIIEHISSSNEKGLSLSELKKICVETTIVELIYNILSLVRKKKLYQKYIFRGNVIDDNNQLIDLIRDKEFEKEVTLHYFIK